MISNAMEKWLNDNLGTFDYPRENGRDSYSFRLQDYTDDQIRKVMTENSDIIGMHDLFEILRESAEDEEALAHLYGDENAATRRESIRRIRELQEKMAGLKDENEQEGLMYGKL